MHAIIHFMIDFNDITIFVIVVLAIAGAIGVIGNAVKTLKEWFKPIGDNSERLEEIEKHVDNDNKRLNSLEESNKLLLRAMNVLIEHETTGNHTEELERVQADITNYLINR